MIRRKTTEWRPGDLVIYRKTKFSRHPGPRARDIAAAPHGDTYSYLVEKYWVVVSVHPEGEIELQTRTGKRHTCNSSDPNLRAASWWERVIHGHRFPKVEAERAQQKTSA